MNLDNISVIIPFGPAEDQLARLLDDLEILGPQVEIIIVTCDDRQIENPRIHQIHSGQGRAIQQNAGAGAAGSEFLWFLHADSRITLPMLTALQAAVKAAPDALHYFNLKFAGDGPPLMLLNEWGAWFRSHILKIPFGDQGFCLRKSHFLAVGGFPEDVPYGEDHLLVWHLRRAGHNVRCVGVALPTSARKYRAYGWAALTLKYQWLWLRQALPQLYKLLKGR
ncbi:hypothetical protein MNBD_ALPHA01-1586 [hydrothermal vent metagenome]|uniref:Glycosyltransferase 2-like domain-containing protein n=1 Tax=hydrothermal vent metagenome TaxID=652676 RepID=A0A3B0SKU7_9ZZZZ